MNTTKRILCLLLGALSLMFVNTARAEIRAGNFTFLPELGIYETYRSNVFLTQHNPQSDFITTISPGMGMRYAFGQRLVFR